MCRREPLPSRDNLCPTCSPVTSTALALNSSSTMPSGIISLIPKGGDASTLRQWRPITLMSSVYKILARMITSRLRPFLPDLIHSSQTGFVQDRSILDNVVTFYEAVEWACQTGQLLRLCFSTLRRHMTEWTGDSWRAHYIGWDFQMLGFEGFLHFIDLLLLQSR
ncbi:hypothetical protein L7F22_059320 [Adiantum nelumboides]|nr:hypothetical protein [Adiantum nelumboides]